jgi:hypothetical protein
MLLITCAICASAFAVPMVEGLTALAVVAVAMAAACACSATG